MARNEAYVLVREDRSGVLYFIRLGLGVFWECGLSVSEARRFTQRRAAAELLHRPGKHRQGWRVIAVSGDTRHGA